MEVEDEIPLPESLPQGFIPVDIFFQSTPTPHMTGEHLKTFTNELKNTYEIPLVLHIMPGNDRTWPVSPLKQWTQTGSGLAVPYQKEQGEPEHILPNYFVFPVPTTFKNADHKSLGDQRRCLDAALAQLYYYAGLGFRISVPIRPRSKGSLKEEGIFKTKPHSFAPPESVDGGVLTQFDNYEYAFGAGVDPYFCSRHGAYWEEKLNELDSVLRNQEMPENSPYYWAYQAGQAEAETFRQDIEIIESIQWNEFSPSEAAELKVRCTEWLEKKYFSFNPFVQQYLDPLVDDPKLRKALKATIEELQENYNQFSRKADSDTDKATALHNGIVYLTSLLEQSGSEFKDFSYDERSARIESELTKLRRQIEAVRDSNPIPAAVTELLDEISKTYPPKPEEPKLNATFFLFQWIPMLIYWYDTWCYDSAKEKLENQATNAKAREDNPFTKIPNETFYMVINGAPKAQNNSLSFFPPSIAETTLSYIENNLEELPYFLNKEAAILRAKENESDSTASTASFILCVKGNKAGQPACSLLDANGKMLEKNVSWQRDLERTNTTLLGFANQIINFFKSPIDSVINDLSEARKLAEYKL